MDGGQPSTGQSSRYVTPGALRLAALGSSATDQPASQRLMDPLPLVSLAQPSAITTAVLWLEALLLGSVATAIATIAVAAIGFMTLTGRIHSREAGRVVLGCFILFGAHSIASGIQAATVRISGGAPADIEVTVPPQVTLAPVAQAARAPYDPFAGASVPRSYECCDEAREVTLGSNGEVR